MLDRVTTLAALALFTAFLAVVVIFVEEIDLAIICLIVLAMALVEFWPVIRRGQREPDREA